MKYKARVRLMVILILCGVGFGILGWYYGDTPTLLLAFLFVVGAAVAKPRFD